MGGLLDRSCANEDVAHVARRAATEHLQKEQGSVVLLPRAYVGSRNDARRF
jgi:hypothetical protein